MIDCDRLPVIPAKRILLRWLVESDLDALFKIFSHTEVTRYWSAPPLPDPAAARELLSQIHEYFREKSLFQWGVATREDNRIIGTCTLAALDPTNRRAELGFALDRGSWGKGYMSEALDALLGFAFGEMKLHRIEADVDPRNRASIRLLERLGFQFEGRLRERWLVNDETQDSLYYGLLRREWPRNST